LKHQPESDVRTVEFQLLDGVRVSDGQWSAKLGNAAQPLTFLAALCLAEGHQLTKRELAEWIWDDGPRTPGFDEMLDSLARTVRFALRGSSEPNSARAADPLPKARGNAGYYQLAVEPVEVDVLRFRSLANSAREAAGRDPAEAANFYRSALDVWPGRGGTLFGGVPLRGLPGKRAQEYRELLQREHRAVLVDYLDLQLAQNANPGLVEELTRLAQTDDGRRDADVVRLLMCAHQQRGDLLRALTVYQNMEAGLRLDDRARRLRQLYESIRRSVDSADDPAGKPDAAATDRTPSGGRSATFVNHQYGPDARNYQAETIHYRESDS